MRHEQQIVPSDIGIPAAWGLSILSFINDWAEPLVLFVIAVLTAIWTVYRIIDSRMSIKIKKEQLEDLQEK